MKNWYVETFGEIYPVIYGHRTVEAAAPEARFAADVLELSPRDRVLDLGCGGGRHMAHLNGRVSLIAGLDYSSALLDEARRLMPQCDVVRADMRAMPFAGAFDAVVNFFTSFGYFTDEENAGVAGQIAAALRPGGRFFVDYFLAGHARANLQAESIRRINGLTIEETRWIDEVNQRLKKTTKVYEEGALSGEYHESVRLYEPEDFQRLFETQGLAVRHFYGDYDGAPLAPGKPRMIAVGSKR